MEEVLSDLPESGLVNLFLKHTSAGICLGENTDPDVRKDLEDSLNRLAPENSGYRHNDEGSDDMPAHIKQTITGASLTIPVVDHRLALGRWQGIYLCEFRNDGGRRTLIVTVTE